MNQAQESASARQQTIETTRNILVPRSNDSTTQCRSDRSVQCLARALQRRPQHRGQRPQQQQQQPLSLRVSIILSVRHFRSSRLHRLATGPQSTRVAVSRRQLRSSCPRLPSRLHQPRRGVATRPPRDLQAPSSPGAGRGSEMMTRSFVKSQSGCAS